MYMHIAPVYKVSDFPYLKFQCIKFECVHSTYLVLEIMLLSKYNANKDAQKINKKCCKNKS